MQYKRLESISQSINQPIRIDCYEAQATLTGWIKHI